MSRARHAKSARVSVPAESTAGDDRTDQGPPKQILKTLLQRVRTSDGQIASYRNDGVALGLHLSHWVLLIAALLVLWRSNLAGSWWWMLLLSAMADILARIRMLRSVRLMESRGAAVKPSLDSLLVCRLYEFMARRCDVEEEKLLARASDAELQGDQHSADKYRIRADRERKRAEECRGVASAKVPERHNNVGDDGR